jgi:hypothetical protein
MTTPQRCRIDDYRWRAFPLGEARAYRQAHAYPSAQFIDGVYLLTPLCEEGSLHPLGHDRNSVGGPIAAPGVRIPRCVRCGHRWDAAVLETQQAEATR